MNRVGEASAIQIPIQEGRLRRQLIGELDEIADVIRTNGLRDEMTLLITDWKNRFEHLLRNLHGDEERVCHEFIVAMQTLLVDPITQAPLDELSVLGSDRVTYGQMSLAVHELLVLPEFRGRSPLNPDNPEPFLVASHPVVRHMVHWLDRHDARLYSLELRDFYEQLLHQAPPENRERFWERIAVHGAELEQRQIERSRELNQEFEQRLTRGLQQVNEELQEPMLALDLPLEQGPLSVSMRDIEERFGQFRQQQGAAVHRLEGRLHEIEHQFDGVFDQMRIEAPRIPFRGRMENLIEEGLRPLAERIDQLAHRALEAIQEEADHDIHDFARLHDRIAQVRAEIDELHRERILLDERQRVVALHIQQAQGMEDSLEISIHKTKRDIENKKKKTWEKILNAIAITGSALFATWALQSVGLSVFPKMGGFRLLYTKRM